MTYNSQWRGPKGTNAASGVIPRYACGSDPGIYASLSAGRDDWQLCRLVFELEKFTVFHSWGLYSHRLIGKAATLGVSFPRLYSDMRSQVKWVEGGASRSGKTRASGNSWTTECPSVNKALAQEQSGMYIAFDIRVGFPRWIRFDSITQSQSRAKKQAHCAKMMGWSVAKSTRP